MTNGHGHHHSGYTAGHIAAAGLGYVGGNIPGAVEAWSGYDRAYHAADETQHRIERLISPGWRRPRKRPQQEPTPPDSGRRKRPKFLSKEELDSFPRMAKLGRKKGRGKTSKTLKKFFKQIKKNKRLRRKSKSRKHKREVIVRPPPTGISHSTKIVKYKKPKMKSHEWRALTQPYVKETANTWSLTVPNGIQNLVGILDNFKTSDIQTLFNEANAYLGTGASGGVFNVTIQNFQKSFKLYLDHVENMFQFTNQGFGAIEVELYDCISKVTSDTYIAPGTAWGQGLTDEESSFTNTAFFPDTNPFLSKEFNLRWRVVRRTHVLLGPGRSHEHLFHHKVNRPVDTQYCSKFACIRGITSHTMIVARGQVADTVSSTSGGPTVGSITIAPVKIVGIYRQKYQTRSLPMMPRIVRQINNIAGISTTTAAYAPQEGSGVAVDINQTFA